MVAQRLSGGRGVRGAGARAGTGRERLPRPRPETPLPAEMPTLGDYGLGGWPVGVRPRGGGRPEGGGLWKLGWRLGEGGGWRDGRQRPVWWTTDASMRMPDIAGRFYPLASLTRLVQWQSVSGALALLDADGGSIPLQVDSPFNLP